MNLPAAIACSRSPLREATGFRAAPLRGRLEGDSRHHS